MCILLKISAYLHMWFQAINFKKPLDFPFLLRSQKVLKLIVMLSYWKISSHLQYIKINFQKGKLGSINIESSQWCQWVQSYGMKVSLTTKLLFCKLVQVKDYKGVYRLASKIKDEGFEADLYKKHWCTCTLCPVQYKHTSWKECCKVLASFCG